MRWVDGSGKLGPCMKNGILKGETVTLNGARLERERQ